jgi:hypothetical protein
MATSSFSSMSVVGAIVTTLDAACSSSWSSLGCVVVVVVAVMLDALWELLGVVGGGGGR